MVAFKLLTEFFQRLDRGGQALDHLDVVVDRIGRAVDRVDDRAQLVFWFLQGLRDHVLPDTQGGAKRPEYEVEHYPIPFSIGIGNAALTS